MLSNGSKRKLPTKVLSFASEILCIHLEKRSKLRSNIILQLLFIRLFLMSYYHIASCLAFPVFQIYNLRSTIKIKLCHQHYKLMWNFPDIFIDVPWIFPFIWLVAHTNLLFFALYTSALYILQGVVCDRERSFSCYFLPWFRIWEEGWNSKTKI